MRSILNNLVPNFIGACQTIWWDAILPRGVAIMNAPFVWKNGSWHLTLNLWLMKLWNAPKSNRIMAGWLKYKRYQSWRVLLLEGQPMWWSSTCPVSLAPSVSFPSSDLHSEMASAGSEGSPWHSGPHCHKWSICCHCHGDIVAAAIVEAGWWHSSELGLEGDWVLAAEVA